MPLCMAATYIQMYFTCVYFYAFLSSNVFILENISRNMFSMKIWQNFMWKIVLIGFKTYTVLIGHEIHDLGVKYIS